MPSWAFSSTYSTSSTIDPKADSEALVITPLSELSITTHKCFMSFPPLLVVNLGSNYNFNYLACQTSDNPVTARHT